MLKRLFFIMSCTGAVCLASTVFDSGTARADHLSYWGNYRGYYGGPYYRGTSYYAGYGSYPVYGYRGTSLSIGFRSYPSYYGRSGYRTYPYGGRGYRTGVYYRSPVIIRGSYGYYGPYGHCHY